MIFYRVGPRFDFDNFLQQGTYLIYLRKNKNQFIAPFIPFSSGVPPTCRHDTKLILRNIHSVKGIQIATNFTYGQSIGLKIATECFKTLVQHQLDKFQINFKLISDHRALLTAEPIKPKYQSLIIKFYRMFLDREKVNKCIDYSCIQWILANQISTQNIPETHLNSVSRPILPVHKYKQPTLTLRDKSQETNSINRQAILHENCTHDPRYAINSWEYLDSIHITSLESLTTLHKRNQFRKCIKSMMDDQISYLTILFEKDKKGVVVKFTSNVAARRIIYSHRNTCFKTINLYCFTDVPHQKLFEHEKKLAILVIIFITCLICYSIGQLCTYTGVRNPYFENLSIKPSLLPYIKDIQVPPTVPIASTNQNIVLNQPNKTYERSDQISYNQGLYLAPQPYEENLLNQPLISSFNEEIMVQQNGNLENDFNKKRDTSPFISNDLNFDDY